MIDVETFLDELYRLAESDEHKAVDAVYDFVDECLLNGNFSLCDAALDAAMPERMSPAAVIAFLLITRRAKSRLRAREGFFARALDSLNKDPAAAEDALVLRKYQ